MSKERPACELIEERGTDLETGRGIAGQPVTKISKTADRKGTAKAQRAKPRRTQTEAITFT